MSTITAATSWRLLRVRSIDKKVLDSSNGGPAANQRQGKGCKACDAAGQTFTNCSYEKHNFVKMIGYLNTQAKGSPSPMRFLPPKTHTLSERTAPAVLFPSVPLLTSGAAGGIIMNTIFGFCCLFAPYHKRICRICTETTSNGCRAIPTASSRCPPPCPGRPDFFRGVP